MGPKQCSRREIGNRNRQRVSSPPPSGDRSNNQRAPSPPPHHESDGNDSHGQASWFTPIGNALRSLIASSSRPSEQGSSRRRAAKPEQGKAKHGESKGKPPAIKRRALNVARKGVKKREWASKKLTLERGAHSGAFLARMKRECGKAHKCKESACKAKQRQSPHHIIMSAKELQDRMHEHKRLAAIQESEEKELQNMRNKLLPTMEPFDSVNK